MKPGFIDINSDLFISASEVEFTYARSSGPGGQNVNKVNSKAILRWNLLNSPSLNEEYRTTLLGKLSGKLNQEGDLLISSDVYRDQIRNREECLLRFKNVIAAALLKPKKRKKTKQSWSSQKRNEVSKKKHSEKKKLRRVEF